MYVIAPPRLRRRGAAALHEAGVTAQQSFVHVPDLERSLLLIPLVARPARWAVRELLLLPGWKRRALGLFPPSLLRLRGPVGLLARRPDGPPPFGWLGGKPVRAVVIARTRPQATGSFVVHAFDTGLGPSRVAKVGATDAAASALAREERALRVIGPGAAAAGVALPEPSAAVSLGMGRALTMPAIAGKLGATLLAAEPRRLEPVLSGVAKWLCQWNRTTAKPLRLTLSELERRLLEPAAVVAPQLPRHDGYLDSLRTLAETLLARETRTVHGHNDLTMWNVLVGEDRKLAVVDWESASEDALPLEDWYYAFADAVAASQRYRDRAGAIIRALGSESGELETRVSDAVGLAPWEASLAFHTCWLHHAANEVRKGRPGPFVAIVAATARGECGR